MKVNLVRISQNAKLGPIPAAYVSEETCPDVCPLKHSGCYGDSGNVAIHWKKVSAGKTGVEWPAFIDRVKALPRHTLWRYAVVGDIPHTDGLIDVTMLDGLVKANSGKRGWAYSHHNVTLAHNQEAIAGANARGFTVNLSADSLEEVDLKYALGIAPVVTLLPRDAGKVTRTQGGIRVVTCPATLNKQITCSNCGICQRADRRVVIGFPAHGSGAKKAEQIFRGIKVQVTQVTQERKEWQEDAAASRSLDIQGA